MATKVLLFIIVLQLLVWQFGGDAARAGFLSTVEGLSSYNAKMSGVFECEITIEDGADEIVIEECTLSDMVIE